MRVLVVDDQKMLLTLLGCQLSHAGHKVIGCHSGEEAMDKLKSQTVDMVLTDMEMGEKTGEDVLAYVRKEFGSLPVVLMSGNPSNLERKGFDGYLSKPFSMQELLHMVEKLRRKPHPPTS